MSVTEIHINDSSDVYEVKVKDENGNFYDITDPDWSGKLVVRETIDGADIISKALTKSADGKRFFGHLTPTETGGLDVDQEYFLTIEVQNILLLFPFRRENQRKIKIIAEGA